MPTKILRGFFSYPPAVEGAKIEFKYANLLIINKLNEG